MGNITKKIIKKRTGISDLEIKNLATELKSNCKLEKLINDLVDEEYKAVTTNVINNNNMTERETDYMLNKLKLVGSVYISEYDNKSLFMKEHSKEEIIKHLQLIDSLKNTVQEIIKNLRIYS